MFDERLVTVWSAPNYCYRHDLIRFILRCGNKAAIMEVSPTNPKPEFRIFLSVSDTSKIQNYRTVVPYFL